MEARPLVESIDALEVESILKSIDTREGMGICVYCCSKVLYVVSRLVRCLGLVWGLEQEGRDCSRQQVPIHILLCPRPILQTHYVGTPLHLHHRLEPTDLQTFSAPLITTNNASAPGDTRKHILIKETLANALGPQIAWNNDTIQKSARARDLNSKPSLRSGG